MRRRITSSVAFVAACLVLVALPWAAAQSETPALNSVIKAFVEGKVVGDTVYVGDDPTFENMPVSPFGGPSTAPMDMTARATVDDTIEVVVHPGPPFTQFMDMGVDLTFVPEVKADGSIEMVIVPPAIPQQWVPPVDQTQVDTVIDDFFFGHLLGDDMPVDFADQFATGQPFPVNGAMFVPTGDGVMPSLTQPFVVRGARTHANPDGSICDGQIVEMFSADHIEGFIPWVAQPFAPNDSFAGTDHAWVTRCVNGQLQPTQLLVNNGSNFQPAPTGAMSLVYPDAFFQLIPSNEVFGSMGSRTGVFVTDGANPFQPDNSAFSSLPVYPELQATAPPVFMEHPWQPATIHPIAFGFSEGDQGTPAFENNYGILIDAKDESGEIGEFSVEIFQFDRYQLSQGLVTYDSDTNTITDGVVTGSGEGYTESYDFGTGVYTYDTGTPEVFDFAVVAGAIDSVYSEMDELTEARLAAALVDTTTTTQSSSTGESTDSTLAPTTKEASGDAIDPFIWLILIGLFLLVLGFIFWLLFGRKKPDPCAELFAAWQKAKAACDKAMADAKAKRAAADKATTAREQADKALDDHCAKYPPACGPAGSASSGGRTVTRDDLWVNRAWNAAAWKKYKDGGDAADTQKDWNDGPSDEFRDTAQQELDAAKARTPGLKKAAEDAQKAETDANAAADKAEAEAKKACDAAAAAKKAYDDCTGAAGAAAAAADSAAASAAGAAAGGIAGAAAGAAVATGGGGAPNCDPQQQAYDAAKKECDDATAASKAADQAVADAHTSLDDAEKALEDLCEEYPPLCGEDAWIQGAGDPDSRIDRSDLFAQDLWSEQVWTDYQTDQIDAQQVQDLWNAGPSDEFIRDAKQKLKDAAPLKPAREQAIKDAKAKLADAEQKAKDAKEKADDACAKAKAAKQALDACLGT